MPTLLLLAASPTDQDRLSLNREVKRIKYALERSRNRENWRIETNEATTIDDLRRALLDFKPTVLHFSGHGGGTAGLCFEDDDGLTQGVAAEPLTRLLHHFKAELSCVVLGACYSTVQAEAIKRQVDFVIGMKGTIGDESAIRFSVAFYDAVFAGASYRTAFDIGCTNIDLHGLGDVDAPVFHSGRGDAALDLHYSEMIPDIEDFLLRYLRAPFTDRHRFATKGDSLAQAIAEFYGGQMQIAPDKVTVAATKKIDDRYWSVLAEIERSGQREHWTYYLRFENRSMLLDWEATVGFWSMPLTTYKALGSATTVTARVTAKLDNVYHGPFSDMRHLYQSVSLRDVRGDTLFAYVARSSAVCDKLVARLRDGNGHRLTLAIGNWLGGDPEHSLITEILSDNWLLNPT